MTQRYTHRIDSPVGPLTLFADGDDLTGLYMGAHQGAAALADGATAAPARFDAVVEQLEEYFAGRLRTFTVTTAGAGTPFQQRVWAALCEIPYGTTASYRDIAERIGAPKAVRAVGLANGRNPISIVVPCHRVIGATGSLTGYGGGLERKRILLDLEAAAVAPSGATSGGAAQSRLFMH